MKRTNVSVKYLNYCAKSRNAPLSAKLDVLEVCASSSIIYACETWGKCSDSAEQLYRSGLRIAMDIRDNINNEIVYIESGRHPLECRIKKLQHKFWTYSKEYMIENPESALAKVLSAAIEDNVHIIRYYKDLDTKFETPESCQNSLRNNFEIKWRNKFSEENDSNSRLGTYYDINPELKPWVPIPQNMMESERKIITRFRTGSHSLNIEIMRYSNIERERRLCTCKNGVQNIWHVFMECPLTTGINTRHYQNLKEIFEDDNLHSKLINISTRLKIPLGRI